MTTKKKSPSPRSLAIRDNVPAGFEVSLDGGSPLKSFAALFRDELRARGVGVARRDPPKKQGS